MARLTDAKLDEIDATAEAATSRPWVIDRAGTLSAVLAPDRTIVGYSGDANADNDNELIATMDPDTTRDLVANLREARRDAEGWREAYATAAQYGAETDERLVEAERERDAASNRRRRLSGTNSGLRRENDTIRRDRNRAQRLAGEYLTERDEARGLFCDSCWEHRRPAGPCQVCASDAAQMVRVALREQVTALETERDKWQERYAKASEHGAATEHAWANAEDSAEDRLVEAERERDDAQQLADGVAAEWKRMARNFQERYGEVTAERDALRRVSDAARDVPEAAEAISTEDGRLIDTETHGLPGFSATRLHVASGKLNVAAMEIRNALAALDAETEGDPHTIPQEVIDAMAEHCHCCCDRPCDGAMAGGVCDGRECGDCYPSDGEHDEDGR